MEMKTTVMSSTGLWASHRLVWESTWCAPRAQNTLISWVRDMNYENPCASLSSLPILRNWCELGRGRCGASNDTFFGYQLSPRQILYQSDQRVRNQSIPSRASEVIRQCKRLSCSLSLLWASKRIIDPFQALWEQNQIIISPHHHLLKNCPFLLSEKVI